jgi:hypothetical protein
MHMTSARVASFEPIQAIQAFLEPYSNSKIFSPNPISRNRHPKRLAMPPEESGATAAAKFVTSTVGNTVGGVANTVGGVVGAAGRGLGETIEGATGSVGRPVGNAVAYVTSGIEGGSRIIAKGVKDAGNWK